MRPVLSAFLYSEVTAVISWVVLGLCARFATPTDGLEDSGQLLVMSLLQFLLSRKFLVLLKAPSAMHTSCRA